MSLVIDLLKENEFYQVILSDSKKQIRGFRLINDSSCLSDYPWFSDLKNHDVKGLMSGLTEDQLIALSFFFIKESVTSVMIMEQWFRDLGLPECLSEELADFLYISKVTSLGEVNYLDEIIPDEKWHNTNTSDFSTHNQGFAEESKAFSDESRSLNTPPAVNFKELLHLLTEEKKIRWIFSYLDSHVLVAGNEEIIDLYIGADEVVINMAHFKESSFMVEDHSCIVIGFSSTFTAFIEVIMHNYPAAIKKFCSLIRVSDRDTTTIGSLLLSNPIFLNYLSINFNRIEFCGFNETGQLIVWDVIKRDTPACNLWNLNLQKADYRNGQPVIPLFMKAIK